jgi:isoleucyl-tRNA synthetase
VRRPLAPEGKGVGQPNRRWTDEIRPRRQALLRPLEAFRAAGHKSLEAWITVKPDAAERPHWEWNRAHLLELGVVSRLDVSPDDAAGETEITVAEAPGPTCPRCWRRTGEASGAAVAPDLCRRCADVVAHLPATKGNA